MIVHLQLKSTNYVDVPFTMFQHHLPLKKKQRKGHLEGNGGVRLLYLRLLHAARLEPQDGALPWLNSMTGWWLGHPSEKY